jgi:hypothetical protein
MSWALFAATQSSADSRPMTSLQAAIAVLASCFWSSSMRGIGRNPVRAAAGVRRVRSKVLIGAVPWVVMHPDQGRTDCRS